jgi:TetR/AcrR family transcriptional regulator, cholesterol catabolism regulator
VRAEGATATQKPQAETLGNRRSEILSVAASLFAERGFENTTVRQIGHAVGLLSGSLYHYFESKEEIAAEVIISYLRQRLEDCQQLVMEHSDPRELLAELLRTEIRDAADHPAARLVNRNSMAVLALMPVYQPIKELAVGVRNVWMDAIHRGIAEGLFREDVDPEVFYSLARKSASMAMQIWVGGLGDGPEQMAARYGVEGVCDAWITVLLNGFQVHQGTSRAASPRTKARPPARARK